MKRRLAVSAVAFILALSVRAQELPIGPGTLRIGMSKAEVREALPGVETGPATNDDWILSQKQGEFYSVLGFVNFKAGRLCQISRSWVENRATGVEVISAVHALFRDSRSWTPVMARFDQRDVPGHSTSTLELFIPPGRTISVTLIDGNAASIQESVGDCSSKAKPKK